MGYMWSLIAIVVVGYTIHFVADMYEIAILKGVGMAAFAAFMITSFAVGYYADTLEEQVKSEKTRADNNKCLEYTIPATTADEKKIASEGIVYGSPMGGLFVCKRVKEEKIKITAAKIVVWEE